MSEYEDTELGMMAQDLDSLRGQRDDLLVACEAMLESAVMLMGDDGFYQCNHCGGTAYGGPSSIIHDNACATVKAQAAIAKTQGE